MGTTETVKVFIDNREIPWEQMDKGVKRKIMAWDDRLMVVKVSFDKGGVGNLHQHSHSQITHVESGIFGAKRKCCRPAMPFIYHPM